MYWTVPPAAQTAQSHAEGLMRLLEWAMSQPDARLGVDPKGVGLIVRSLYALARKRPRPRIDRWLDQVGATEGETLPFPQDKALFGPDICHLLRYLRKAQDEGGYLWLEEEDARWWVQKTAAAFNEYTRLFPQRDESHLLRLFVRHRCVVWAALNGPALLTALYELLQATLEEYHERTRHLLQWHGIAKPEDLTIDRPVYWSWRLTDFGASRGNLLWQPMLALWDAWPASRGWAPPPPPGTTVSPRLSPQEAADLLENFLWEKLERVFALARQACGLGLAEPEFAEMEVRPPVFYFVAPVSPPKDPQNYVEDLMPLLFPLVRKCLASDDPLSQEIAWGLLEGDLVTLRRERVSREGTRSWYLLLPVANKEGETVSEEIEGDLGFLADSLTFVEFTIGDDARDIATDLEEVGTRQALWGGTLHSVSEQLSEAFSLGGSVTPRDRHQMSSELWEMLLLLHRWRALMEKMHSDAAQVLRKYQGYLDATEDFVRRSLTFSFPLPPFLRSLGDALQDAYPYHYLREPLKSLENQVSVLSTNIANVIASLDAALSRVEQQAREMQEQAMQWLSLVLALLALVIGVPQLIPGAAISEANYPLWLSRVLPLHALESSTRILVVVLMALLAALFAGMALRWLLSRFPRQDRFSARIRQLQTLLERAEQIARLTVSTKEMLSSTDLASLWLEREVRRKPLAQQVTPGWQLERLDRQACELLAELWGQMREAEKLLSGWRRLLGWLARWSRQVEAWLVRNRRLRYLIALFDLRPANIPLPRTLCVFRYKSTDFHARSVISDWEFNRSLRLAGFAPEERALLEKWLSEMENQRAIQGMDVPTFINVLRERGVSADPALRKPKEWRGALGVTR
jgi:hypothetical protein